MNGTTIRCKECGSDFFLTNDERDFFARRGLNLPKRCPHCRKKGNVGNSQKGNSGFACRICGRRGQLKVQNEMSWDNQIGYIMKCGFCNGTFEIVHKR